jgi:hypothetical protein
LVDLQRSEVPVGNLKRVDLYYQEWDGNAQRFEGDKVEGSLSVEDLFRGELASALALRFDLTFTDAGEDGALGTDDDLTRRLTGSLVTSPTVAQAVDEESVLARSRRSADYDPDGDVYVSCVGETYVDERSYEEDSNYYQDDDGGGCTGDTWKDDGVDPQESGGCAGEETVDDGEPDPSGGCTSDDEFEDDEQPDDGTGDGTGEDSYYDDEGYDDGSGCADTTDDTSDTTDDSSSDGYEDSGDCGCSGDSTDTSTDSSSSDSFEDSGDCGGCEGGDSGGGDTFDSKPGLGSGIGTGRAGHTPASSPAPVAAACGVGLPTGAISNVQRAYLRRALAELEGRPARGAEGRWSKAEWKQVKGALRHLPFVMLGVGLWSLRRRKAR